MRYLSVSCLLVLCAISLGGEAFAQPYYKIGGIYGRRGSLDGQFQNPQGLAVAADGSLWVADTNNGRIQKLTADGKFVTAFGRRHNSTKKPNELADKYVDLGQPSDVAVGTDGSLYVTDQQKNCVDKLSPEGKSLATWGSFGTDAGQFNRPAGIALDSSGNVYVTDEMNNRVEKFDGSGKFLTQWGTQGKADGQFDMPWGIATDKSSNVWVADWRNDRVQEFDGNGKHLLTITGTDTAAKDAPATSANNAAAKINHPSDIAVSPQGLILVMSWGSGAIQAFRADGTFDGADMPRERRPGAKPTAIAMAADGTIYLTDSFNSVVVALKPNATRQQSTQTRKPARQRPAPRRQNRPSSRFRFPVFRRLSAEPGGGQPMAIPDAKGQLPSTPHLLYIARQPQPVTLLVAPGAVA